MEAAQASAGSAHRNEIRPAKDTLVEVPNTPLPALERAMGFRDGRGFSYVHLDCEGCACAFLREHPTLVRRARAVTLEKDGHATCDYTSVARQLTEPRDQSA